jgi:hypothetical protein
VSATSNAPRSTSIPHGLCKTVAPGSDTSGSTFYAGELKVRPSVRPPPAQGIVAQASCRLRAPLVLLATIRRIAVLYGWACCAGVRVGWRASVFGYGSWAGCPEYQNTRRLRLPPAPRGTRRTDARRTSGGQDEAGVVTGVLGTHHDGMAERVGFEPARFQWNL